MNRTFERCAEEDNFKTIGQLVDDILRGLTVSPSAQIIQFPTGDKYRADRREGGPI